ncbi:MAG: hypothetical protein WC884_04040 [Candidatus Paceibacterota bacterium]
MGRTFLIKNYKKIFNHQITTRKGGYKTESGTIKNKVDFCKKTIDGITKEEVSQLAVNLAKDIYSFVTENK